MPSADYRACLQDVEAALRSRLHFDKTWQDQEIHQMLSALVLAQSRPYDLTLEQKQDLVESLFNQMRRMDLIQPLLDDEAVTDVLVNGPQQIFVEREGELCSTSLTFPNAEALEDLIQRICAQVNRQVSEASPLVDARLPDGSRMGAVLPPVALNGPILAIRKFSPQNIPLDTLVHRGTLTSEAAETIRQAVLQRWNLFISGGTGSGKTTLLNTLANMVPDNERLVTIEDAAELQIRAQANLVRMEARPPNTEGKGEITLRQLIRMALRLRPDRIIVGEVRGAEAFDMLQAMNTGHEGAMSTGHSNSSLDMLARIETMALMANVGLPAAAIRRQIGSALDLIVHLARDQSGNRKVVEIRQILGHQGERVESRLLFYYDGRQLLRSAEPMPKKRSGEQWHPSAIH
ncbi:MAG TPA: pilus assembly protein [Peptococcaceae bacterium]|nr:pilus assembly protein [Peptococcaceae bacterium]